MARAIGDRAQEALSRGAPRDVAIVRPAALRAAGITPLDFAGNPPEEPVVLAWMPAGSLYFRDPDGNLIEFLAMLPDAAEPKLGVVGWAAWTRRGGAR